MIKHQPPSQGLSSSHPLDHFRGREEDTDPGKEVDKTYVSKEAFF